MEANAAVNHMQQAKAMQHSISCVSIFHTSRDRLCAREHDKRSRASPTTSWWVTRAVGEIKFSKIFVHTNVTGLGEIFTVNILAVHEHTYMYYQEHMKGRSVHLEAKLTA